MEFQFVFLLLVWKAALMVHAQDGFISLDCGTPPHTAYLSGIGLVYTSDESYVSTGVVQQIASNHLLGSTPQIYHTVRSFPFYKRNCYSLAPLTAGKRYLVRASFMYGNYDGLNQPPIFLLYMALDLWATVQLDNATHIFWTEMIRMATSTSLTVCLVDADRGTPFISALELRRLSDSLYSPANDSFSVVTFKRIDFGSTTEHRFPDDPLDRIWAPDSNAYGSPLATTREVKDVYVPSFATPSSIMQTAATTSSAAIMFGWAAKPDVRLHIYLHFAELIQTNRTRNITITESGSEWTDPFVPAYLISKSIYSINPFTKETYAFSIYVTKESTLGPLINAAEVYEIRDVARSATNRQDAVAIMGIKDSYQVKKNWISDPCLPQSFPWDGLNCSYANPDSPTIISLDLSNSGLTGSISNFFPSFMYIQSLNLSGNKLQGSIPDFLATLTSLRTLDLSSNDLSGTIPSNLKEAMNSGLLSVRLDNNPNLCLNDPCKKKHKSLVIYICIPVVFVLAAVTIVIIMKKKYCSDATSNEENKTDGKTKAPEELSPVRKIQHQATNHNSHLFMYNDILRITNNFQKPIGKGGSGTVFLGHLSDGREVAVKKVTRTAMQRKEFAAEVSSLTQVHHKYLVSFYGFCKEEENMILVYQYMRGGNLRQLLSDKTDKSAILTWEKRLQIALSVATGLDYLHSGCRPPIIHRDVKSANILLDSKYEAKLGDFGLSKAIPVEDISHVSTINVAGTTGYIDPEYYITGKLTKKSDVYGFGVVLFELITGYPAFISEDGEATYLVQWAKSKISQGDFSSIADSRLSQGQYDADSLQRVADIADASTSGSSIERPTMGEIVSQLKAAQKKHGRVEKKSFYP